MGQFMINGLFYRLLSRCTTQRKLLSFLLIGAMLLSCSGSPVRSDRSRGVYHRVKSGETLSAIARAYHVKLQDLAEINNISKPDQIETDSVIFIPDASQVVDDVITAARSQAPPVQMQVYDATDTEAKTAKAPAVPRKEPQKKETVTEPVKKREKPPVDMTTKDHPTPPRVMDRDGVAPGGSAKVEGAETVDQTEKKKEIVEKADEIQFDKDRFIWPVKGKVVSRFGIQPNRMNYNGIRIAATEEAAVQAAAGGTVIFSAPLKEYGETIIIKHEDNYATVYTHLGTRTVRGDVRVKKGDRIAFLGKTDERVEPYLYFEIRHKNKARNPLFFLP
ncbi:MAG: M23 family metallopeptidase [Syntrophales bacterium]|nr:M23 family metallopeptidase [Syntrophales bacterium]